MDTSAPQKVITPWVDIVRVVAMFLVVVIHVSGQLTNVWGQIPPGQWIIADVYGGIARVSVPLFFMISGYLLLPRSETLRDFYSRRIPRIVIPLVAWSAIYLAWFCGGHPGTCTPGVIQDLLLVRGAYYHLWFLYSLLSIYLVVPLLRLMIKPGADRVVLWYLILLWIIFQPLMTIANTLWGFQVNLSAPLAAGFLPYFILGYLLGGITLSRRELILSLVLGALGAASTIVGAYITTQRAGSFNGFFYDFVSLNVIVASAAAFVILRWAGERPSMDSPPLQAAARSVATATFGIYLVHIIVIEVLGSGLPFIHVNSFMGSAWWSVPLVSVVVFIVSFYVVRLLQQIPLVKQIVP